MFKNVTDLSSKWKPYQVTITCFSTERDRWSHIHTHEFFSHSINFFLSWGAAQLCSEQPRAKSLSALWCKTATWNCSTELRVLLLAVLALPSTGTALPHIALLLLRYFYPHLSIFPFPLSSPFPVLIDTSSQTQTRTGFFPCSYRSRWVRPDSRLFPAGAVLQVASSTSWGTFSITFFISNSQPFYHMISG